VSAEAPAALPPYLSADEIALLRRVDDGSFGYGAIVAKSPERDRLKRLGLIRRGRRANAGHSWHWLTTEAGRERAAALRSAGDPRRRP